MNTFNSNFYQADKSFNRQDAEKVMRDNGYRSFEFKSCSFTHGASFYFVADGKDVRVSDHPLTGKRAFDVVQLSLVKINTLKVDKKEKSGVSDLMKGVFATMLKKGVITKEEYEIKIAG